MQLEERIATLENELRLLKEQVQPTLNEIQEHVYARFYPAQTPNDSALDDQALEDSFFAPALNPPSYAIADPANDNRTRVLTEWISTSAPKLGSEPLANLLQVAAQQRLITPDEYQACAGIVPLYPHTPPSVMSAGEMIWVVLELDALLDRPQDVEEALALLQEAKIG